jgi:phosphatidylglycerophosphatase B
LTKEQYDRIEDWFFLHPAALDGMKILNRWLPRVVYCSYGMLLIFLALSRDLRIFRVLLVPAVVFLSVTLLRKLWNFPRPYEALNIHPLIPRDKKGQSFPSRHVASATILAAAFCYICPPLGAAMSPSDF